MRMCLSMYSFADGSVQFTATTVFNFAGRGCSTRAIYSKGDIDEYIAIPLLNNDDIRNEIPLVKFIAFEVLRACSEI